MSKVSTQKTYMGRTAGGWLKECKVEEMSAGNFEIYHPVFGVITLTNDGNMLFDTIMNGDDYETRISLETSKRAYDRMVAMEKEIHARYEEFCLN